MPDHVPRHGKHDIRQQTHLTSPPLVTRSLAATSVDRLLAMPCQNNDFGPSTTESRLARLTTVNLMPEKYSRHMRIMTKIKQICKMRVSCSTTTRGSYIIDVFTPSQSTTRIPTSLKAADFTLAAANEPQFDTLFRKPDSHIEKQFADFVRVRDQLYETAYPHANCWFCSEVIRYLLAGAVLPGALSTWMLPQRQRTKAVQRFLESLLLLAVQCPVVESNACSCHDKLPQLLFKLLFDA
ncbi:unnamed protein product [Phytophthora lilii]|uniref:Unnamed protein product n=1 Tax=Phytophthora lilii TaxID=2077276 RepID=A0A9W6TGK9_9STRA|nr:unnamed protein product [Phytophthora lilii]